MRVQIRFAKRGDLRFIGHRDLMEAFHRLLRRAGITPAYSQGFHPKPRVSFPAALPLNIVGEDEVLEIEMPQGQEDTDPEEIRTRLQQHTIPDLDFLSARAIPTGEKKAAVRAFTYTIAVPEGLWAQVRERLQWFQEQSAVPVERVGRGKHVDLKDGFLAANLEPDGTLRFQLHGNLNNGCGPRDILAMLGIGDLETHGSVLVRSIVHIG